MRKLPLTAGLLEKIKANIARHAETFRTDIIDVKEIGSDPIGGRSLTETTRWPIDTALEYFENHGVAKREGAQLRILDAEFFSIHLEALPLPITFSIDSRIEADVAIMAGFYSQLYDVENRLRFFITERLTQRFGRDFDEALSARVRQSIARARDQTLLFATDTRIATLQFAAFGDLRKILEQHTFVLPDETLRRRLIEYLKELHEIRNLAYHSNRVVPQEVVRLENICKAVRRLLAERQGHQSSHGA